MSDAEGRYRIYAGPGSPYSHKVRAVMRYRRLAHDWVIVLGGFDGTGQAGALAALGKRLLPVVAFPDGGVWNDSTPIIHELETRHPGVRSVLPPSPGDQFLARLVEDFADEWLSVILMAFRWTSDADVAFCARRQMQGWLGGVSEADLGAAIDLFTARQQFVRNVIGGGPEGRAVFDRQYERLLDILEAGLSERLFLFGERPSIADFGLYGMLTQFAIDPTPSQIMRARAVRLFQWVQYTDDLSGHDGEWAPPGAPGATIAALVRLAGEAFLPMMIANAAAVGAKERRASFAVGGATVTSVARPYPAACWVWLKQMFAALPREDREGLRPLLTESGFWDALAFAPGERERAPVFAMM